MFDILAQVAQSTTDTLEVIKSVREYYQDAWNNLIWFFGIGGAVLLVIFPLLLEWWRGRSFKLAEEKILGIIEEKNKASGDALERTKQEVLDQIKKAGHRLEVGERNMSDLASTLWATYARTARDMGDVNNAFGSAIIGINYALGGNKPYTNISLCLEVMAQACADPKNSSKIVLEDPAKVRDLNSAVSGLEGIKMKEEDRRNLEVVKRFVSHGSEAKNS